MQNISADPTVGRNLSGFVKALILGQRNLNASIGIAQAWKDRPAIALTLKAIVEAQDTTGTASALLRYGIAGELIELLSTASILGKLTPYMRHLPTLITVPAETAAASAGWISESAPFPAGRLTYEPRTLSPFKNGVVVIITDELARSSRPSAEVEIKNSLIRSIAAFIDAQFLDAAITLVAGHRPAAITRGATVQVSTGSSAAQTLADLSAMTAALGFWQSPFWVMKPSTASYLAGLQTTGGGLAFPQINVLGGFLLGIPVVTSITSPAQITLLDAHEVLISDEGAELSVSQEATVEMSDAPIAGEASPITGAVLQSLWQRNLTGIKVERAISYLRGHDAAVVSMVVSY